MNYSARLFLTRFPYAFVETRMVGGTLQPCVVIPVKSASGMLRRDGDYEVRVNLWESDIADTQCTSHKLSLVLPKKKRDTLHKKGFFSQDELGFMSPMSAVKRTRSLSVLDSLTTEIYLEGEICLDDIPEKNIGVNLRTGIHSVDCIIKAETAGCTPFYAIGSFIYEMIPDYLIKTGEDGKQRFKCKFKKRSDMRSGRTHSLVVIQEDGSELCIGEFMEYKKQAEKQDAINAEVRKQKKQERDVEKETTGSSGQYVKKGFGEYEF
jgi:hypothetical protein